MDGTESGFARPWSPGDRVGKYRLEGLLGRGGMGEVWAAEDETLRRRVAVKRFLPSYAGRRVRRERFLREARVQALLSSPHIVTVFDAEVRKVPGEEDELLLVMEKVEGRTLAEILAEAPLEVEPALALLRQVADALAVAHRAGVVHRDLKPQNLILRPDGTLVILDFGLAWLKPGAAGESGERLTATDLVVGTTDYMSPEQVRGEELTPASDVWAAGVVLHELLTGKTPFAGASAMDQMAAILRDAPARLEESRPDVPPAVAALVSLCLSKDPLERPQNGEELASRIPIERIPLVSPSSVLYAPEVLARARAHDPLSPRATLLAFAAAVVGVALVAAGALRSWSASGPSRPFVRLEETRESVRALASRLGARAGPWSAEGYEMGDDGRPFVWVRLSPETFLEGQRPPSIAFPPPRKDGEIRAILDAAGRLRLFEWWPDRPGMNPGAVETLLSASGLRGPLAPAEETGRTERGEPLRAYAAAGGGRVLVAERPSTSGGGVLRFGVEGEEPPPVRSALLPPVADAALLGIVAAIALASARNVRGRKIDLGGAVALGAASFLFQTGKLVGKPITFVNGIWFRVELEAAGFALLVFLAYLGFEPAVRRRLPAALLGWTRLATARRADRQVGRELLLGAAALLPFGLLLASGVVSVPLEARARALAGLGVPSVRIFSLLDGLQLGVFLAALLLLLSAPLARGTRSFGAALGVASLLVAMLVVGDLPTDVGTIVLVVATAGLLALLVVKGGVLALVTFLGASRACLDAVPPAFGSFTLPYTAASLLVALVFAGGGLFLCLRRSRDGG